MLHQTSKMPKKNSILTRCLIMLPNLVYNVVLACFPCKVFHIRLVIDSYYSKGKLKKQMSFQFPFNAPHSKALICNDKLKYNTHSNIYSRIKNKARAKKKRKTKKTLFQGKKIMLYGVAEEKPQQIYKTLLSEASIIALSLHS